MCPQALISASFFSSFKMSLDLRYSSIDMTNATSGTTTLRIAHKSLYFHRTHCWKSGFSLRHIVCHNPHGPRLRCACTVSFAVPDVGSVVGIRGELASPCVAETCCNRVNIDFESQLECSCTGGVLAMGNPTSLWFSTPS